MASFIKKRIENLFDIPEDLLVRCIGRGFFLFRKGFPACILEVNTGKGLFLDENNEDKVTVKTGEGLGFDENEAVTIKTGQGVNFDVNENVVVKNGNGIGFDENGAVTVRNGRGLEYDEEGNLKVKHAGGLDCGDCGSVLVKTGIALSIDEHNRVNVNTGSGLLVDEQNRIVVDATVARTENISVQTDTKLSLDKRKLTLEKFYTVYRISKNAVGVIVGFEAVENHTEKDEIILIDTGYGGYGYGANLLKPHGVSAQGLPKFYK